MTTTFHRRNSMPLLVSIDLEAFARRSIPIKTAPTITSANKDADKKVKLQVR